MSDIRISNDIMTSFGYGPTYTTPQMIVGAIFSELDRRAIYLKLPIGMTAFLGPILEGVVRQVIAGDGLVGCQPDVDPGLLGDQEIKWPDITVNLGYFSVLEAKEVSGSAEAEYWQWVLQSRDTEGGWRRRSGSIQAPRPGLVPKQRGAAWYWSEP